MNRPARKPPPQSSTTPPARSSGLLWVAAPFLLCALFISFHFRLHLLPTLSSTTAYPARSASRCDFSVGEWARVGRHFPRYDLGCPFHRNAWNCLRNGRESMDVINSWAWVPRGCGGAIPEIDPVRFLLAMKGRKIGFIGDSLNENFLVAFLCTLRNADSGAKKWKRKGAWRGGYFPRFDVTVAYHRAVLLAKYKWQPKNQSTFSGEDDSLKGIYRVDVDVPADDWANVTSFYDVLVFNTGHWWGLDKFPKETPLVFFKEGNPIVPSLGLLDGLEVVLENMVKFIETKIPRKTIKLWRTQSPRHFQGGEWNQNGSCLLEEPLKEEQLDAWFNPNNNGVNKEARLVNSLIEKALQGSNIQVFNVTHLSEFRADAHPAIWLGKKDAVAVWGQDCMHWCLPGVPDTWVDILSAEISQLLGNG